MVKNIHIKIYFCCLKNGKTINAQSFNESFHLLPTKTITFFEFISHVNHLFYNMCTVIQLLSFHTDNPLNVLSSFLTFNNIL